jgi:hypothetical protein
MKKYFLIFILISILFHGCFNKMSKNSLLNQIELSQKEFLINKIPENLELAKEIEKYSKVRKILFSSLDESGLCKSSKIILFEAYDVQSAIYSGSIWSKNLSYNYEYDSGMKDKIKIKKEPLNYSDFIIENILTDNFSTIKASETKEGKLLGGNHVYVHYIKKIDDRYIINNYEFNEFFSALRAR